MIRNYNLSKFRKVDNTKYPNFGIDTSKLSPFELIVHEYNKSMWEQFNETSIENLIRESYAKHPSTYKNGVNRLIKKGG